MVKVCSIELRRSCVERSLSGFLSHTESKGAGGLAPVRPGPAGHQACALAGTHQTSTGAMAALRLVNPARQPSEVQTGFLMHPVVRLTGRKMHHRRQPIARQQR